MKADNGASCGYADVPVRVLPVATAVSLTAAPATKIPAGYPLDCYAALVDQFGRRMEPQPALTWQVTPAGTLEPLSVETRRFHSGAQPGDYRIVVAAGALSAALPVTVTANQPPQFVEPLDYYSIREGKVYLAARVMDPFDAKNRWLRSTWTIDRQPDGQSTELLNTQANNASLKLPGAGDYVVRLTATIGGMAVSSVKTLHAVADPQGKLLLPPEVKLLNGAGTVTTPLSIIANGFFDGATCRWETSTDNGATWTTIPHVEGRYYAIPKLDASDNGRLLRLNAVNAAGECRSNVANITVKDPKAGILAFDNMPCNVREDAGVATVTVHRLRHAAAPSRSSTKRAILLVSTRNILRKRA